MDPARASGSCRRMWPERPLGTDPRFSLPLLLSPRPARLACRSPRGLGPRPFPSPPSFLVKEEEKQKLLQRGGELQRERRHLEERDRRLASAVQVRGAGGSALGLRGVADQSVAPWLLGPQKRTDSAVSRRGSAGGEGSSAAPQTHSYQAAGHLALLLLSSVTSARPHL